jgi:hypothetical protein
MTWIGDETIIVMMVSAHYSKVMTSKGVLYGGFSKNCYFASALLRKQLKCGEWDLLRGQAFGFPLMIQALGEAELANFLRSQGIDAIIAGPRTYQESKQILALGPPRLACLDTGLDVDSVLVLLSKRCRA